LRKESEINGQTALSTIQKAPITYIVTEMGEDEVAMLGATRVDSLDASVSRALADLAAAGRTDPTIYLMPSAAYTVPFPKLEGAGQQAAD